MVSSATGVSCLIRGSLKLSSSPSCPLCRSPNQATVTLPFYSCIHLQSSELVKTGVTGAQHLLWPRYLFVIPVSPVNECSITPRAKHIPPCQPQKHIYLFSNALRRATAMLRGEEIVISTICLHNYTCYRAIVGSEANGFYL